jgi:hypothetical protein
VTTRRALLLVVVALTALLAWELKLPPLPGRAGVVLLGVSEEHGVHLSDVPAILAWGVGMVTCGWLWRRT